MKIRNLFGAALLSLAAGAQAQPAVTPSAPIAADSAMLATLTRLYPATTFKEVNTTTVPGVFEVVMGQNIAYTDRTGRYFFFGRLFDMQTQSDLTAAKAEQASRLDVGALPIEDAIKTVKGSGVRKLYVFSDPDCPYCQQLERNLAGINDVTIYTFMMPLEGLHPQAKAKAISVWCSADRAKAWDRLMTNGQVPSAGACAHPVDRNIALGGRLGVTGTPTLMSADGRKLPGAAPAERIAQWIDAGAGASR
ncbi:MAG: DsbC family protein [Burkholderiales bacterium]|nr:DsbC family protein [Burkholderiales bacterium]